MLSKLVFALPVISLLYLLQTFFFRPLPRIVRIPLSILAIIVLAFDLFISLYFYTSCIEMALEYGTKTCLSWIYPTLDFKIMVVVSVIVLTISVWALVAGWSRKAFYLLGAGVVYLGVVFRGLVFLQSVKVMNITGSVNTVILFEFFTIIVVYGLVSAAVYFGISLIGFFRRFT
jgi:hypothetical protein